MTTIKDLLERCLSYINKEKFSLIERDKLISDIKEAIKNG